MGELIPNITTKFILSAALIVIITIAAGALFSNSFLPWIKGFITEWNPFRPAEGWELTITSQTDFTEPIPEETINDYLRTVLESLKGEFGVSTLGGEASLKIEYCGKKFNIDQTLLNLDYKTDQNLKELLFWRGMCKILFSDPSRTYLDDRSIPHSLPGELQRIIDEGNERVVINIAVNKQEYEISPDKSINIYNSLQGNTYSELITGSSYNDRIYCPLWSNGQKNGGGSCKDSRVKSNGITLTSTRGKVRDNALLMFWTDDGGNPICKEDKEDKSISPRSSCTIKMNGNKEIHVKAAPLGLLEGVNAG